MVSGITAPGAEIFGSHEFTDGNVRGLETLAASAQPAAERMTSDRWLLRPSSAPTWRVNRLGVHR